MGAHPWGDAFLPEATLWAGPVGRSCSPTVVAVEALVPKCSFVSRSNPVLCLSLLIGVGDPASVLHMGGSREVEPCAQGHTAKKQQTELGLLGSRVGSYLDP